jgi:hypothetical protein
MQQQQEQEQQQEQQEQQQQTIIRCYIVYYCILSYIIVINMHQPVTVTVTFACARPSRLPQGATSADLRLARFQRATPDDWRLMRSLFLSAHIVKAGAVEYNPCSLWGSRRR